jgi:hypothetical protein
MKIGLGIAAPLYLSISWVLTVSYQLLTDTAVKTVGSQIGLVWPSAALWINSNIETIIFIYAFTWIFVLSSVIPASIVGKDRGVLAQYAVVLILSMIAFFMPDILFVAFGFDIAQIISSAKILENVALAIFYLSVPYLFMLGLDLRSRSISKRNKLEDMKKDYLELSDGGSNKILLSESYETSEPEE